MESTDLIIIFFTSMIAGLYGVLSGGGSLLTIPVLILLGVPPITTVASNRMGIMGAIIGSIRNFNNQKLINWKLAFILIPASILGAISGVKIIQEINESIIKYVIGAIIIILLLMIIFKNNIGLKSSKKKITKLRFIIGAMNAFIISIISSIAGGVGTLSSYNLIYVFRQTFLESAGTRKILGLVGSFTAAIMYMYEKEIDYKIATTIFVGSFIGGYISSYFASTVGNEWVKRLFIIVVSIMTIQLFI